MTLLQLKMLREIARQSLNISAAEKALHRSQPGFSRQIQMLEKDVGVQLLVRQRTRIVSLSKAGHAILAAAQVLLNQADNIELLAEDARGGSAGKLVVVTTHLHARYRILRRFKEMKKKCPDVKVVLFQADPDDIPKLVKDGAADIGLNTSDDRSEQHAGVVCLSGNIIRRSAIMRRGHPLARKKRLTLNDFTAYPFVGYNPRSRSGSVIARAFAGSSVAPRSIVQANDSDVIKAYVPDGLGIGVVPDIILLPLLDA